MTSGTRYHRRDEFFKCRWWSPGFPAGAFLGLLHVALAMSILPGIPTAAAASLEVQVNYAHNWIAGTTDPSASVDVEVRDDQDEVKGGNHRNG